MLALIGGGCGTRFEIGEFAQGLDPDAAGTAAIDAPVLADGPEDADATVDEGRFPRALGDVDGDGYDDWMSMQLVYGGPRPSDGVLAAQLDEGPSFAPPNDYYGLLQAGTPAGDVNADGYDDLIFSSFVLHSTSSDDGLDEATRAADLATTSREWLAQRALLWYGGPDRAPGTLELATAAVPLGGHDDLAGRFESELSGELGPDATFHLAEQSITPEALGDVNGDGYADLGVSATFSWQLLGDELGQQIVRGERTESVSYVYYGRGERLEPGARPEPDARLPGVTSLQAIGDVNGDGYADVQALTAEKLYLLPGGAQQLSGELASLDGNGVPVSMSISRRFVSAIGDIDRDGFDDLAAGLENDADGGQRSALFYGSPGFLARAVDESASSAIFAVPGRLGGMEALGDWNGDGSNDILFLSERITTESASDPEARGAGTAVRLIPGRSERFSGVHELALQPDPAQTERYIGRASKAGDIDGDGKADLFFAVDADYGYTTKYVRYGGPLPFESIY
jgi:hypothetical protein